MLWGIGHRNIKRFTHERITDYNVREFNYEIHCSGIAAEEHLIS